MERRANPRINLRLECLFEGSRGNVFRGYTRNFSREGVEMESNDFRLPGREPPKPGDIGVFSLNYRKGPNADTIKVMGRIVYVMGSIAGLSLFVSELMPSQRESLLKILESDSGKID